MQVSKPMLCNSPSEIKRGILSCAYVNPLLPLKTVYFFFA